MTQSLKQLTELAESADMPFVTVPRAALKEIIGKLSISEKCAKEVPETLNRYTMKFSEGFFIIHGADGGIYCRIDYAGVDRAQSILEALNAERPSEISVKSNLYDDIYADLFDNVMVIKDGNYTGSYNSAIERMSRRMLRYIEYHTSKRKAQRNIQKGCPDCGANMIEVCSGLEEELRGDKAATCSYEEMNDKPSVREAVVVQCAGQIGPHVSPVEYAFIVPPKSKWEVGATYEITKIEGQKP